MNKKGFTLVELLAVIIILGVISTVAVFSYNGFIQKSRNDAYKDNETTLKAAAESLIAHCEATFSDKDYCVDIPLYNEEVEITMDKLVEGKFINKMVDPSNSGSYCTGYVKVKNVSSDPLKLEYKTCLRCNDYKSSDCE